MRASPRTILFAGLVVLAPVAPAVVRAAAPPAPPAASEAALLAEPYGKAVGPRRVVSRGAHPWIAWTLASGGEVRTRFDAARWLPQRAELWRGGKAEASLDYHDYRRQGGTWWPSRIQFDWPKEHGRLALTFDRLHFNGALADSLFPPPPPPLFPAFAPSAPAAHTPS